MILHTFGVEVNPKSPCKTSPRRTTRQPLGRRWLGRMPIQTLSQEAVTARQVFRFLHRAGGSADAHYVTGKYLGEHADGSTTW